METIDKTTEILNDLLKINNDRIVGYEKASDEASELDLKTLFRGMADESRKIANELSMEINRLGGEAAIGTTTNSGKIYRVWMDVKTTFTGKDRTAVLNSCEYGEDAAQTAYHDALMDENELPSDLRELIVKQQQTLKASHDVIRNYRDAQAKLNKVFK